jgi:hypothetical protein
LYSFTEEWFGGFFPWFKETSWEGHLFGGLAGLLLSWTYRKEGPQRTKYQWEDEPDEFEDLKMGEFEDVPLQGAGLKMGGSPYAGDRFEDGTGEVSVLKRGDDNESGLKDGEEEMKLEDGEELKESEKVVGQDLFDLSSPKITYEYIEPKKDRDTNATDTDLKNSDKI